ncbi:MAG TPA: hypothetical protein VFJ72_14610 [Rubrobacteraceae bacterium]|nr:hypothetical protein [Rubrobacteraceae bacterium]
MAKEGVETQDIAPGLIVRHTNRRIGILEPCEACERLISGRISFSEFVDQVGDGYRELLDFMMEYDLHPGRPEEVLHCIECYRGPYEGSVLRTQLGYLYDHSRQPEKVC